MGEGCAVVDTSTYSQVKKINEYTREIGLQRSECCQTSELHDKYVVVTADKAPNNIVFVCKSHYIGCLIKELGIESSLGNQTYTPTTLTKEEILFCLLLEFQLKRRNSIFLYFTGFQSSMSVLTSNVTLQGLPIVPQNLFSSY